MAFSGGTSGHATPRSLLLSSLLLFSSFFVFPHFTISPTALPLFLNFHVYLPHLVTKRANYFEAERPRIDARFELIAGGFAKIYDKNMRSYCNMIMPITFVISSVGGNLIIETREIF